MALWKFVRSIIWPVLVMVVGAVVTLEGYFSQAWEVWTAGLKPWELQAIGFSVFVFGVFGALFQFHRKMLIGADPAARADAYGPAIADPPTTESLVEANTKSAWSPDMTMKELAIYVGAESHWAEMTSAENLTTAVNMGQIKAEIAAKLVSGQVTAWGRDHPDSAEFQIRRAAWHGSQLHLGTETAFLPVIPCTIYALRVASDEIKIAWPHR